MSAHVLTTCPVCGIRRKRYVDNAEERLQPCAACEPMALMLAHPVGDWTEQAVCTQVDPELFFPPPNAWTAIDQCRRICASCPVRIECLTHALEADERHGIWGGLTRRERTRLKAKQNGSAA